ncbi:spermatogenesis associated 6-like protein [Xyrichtys novacula]|uniref:Spermatogenesis associated 6-like protein n=1 Tax=Xyrichtys novacula TaxID=13765 RepID=A0AAV1HKE3_XYRNO|nr:spermatogenesis associated 6-like protein [Xyrichtys novacula]
MSWKALKVVVELKFRAVSCPGVHLAYKDDIYLSIQVMGQYRQSECLPAVFPLLFYEKMSFEKIYRQAVDPADITAMLETETIRIDLVQLTPPSGDTLAFIEEDAARFLFPGPKLVPSYSGVDREVLMIRAPHFPGIAPRLEFSSKVTIIQCPTDAKINFYPNELLRPVIKRGRKPSSRHRTSSPQRRKTVRMNGETLSGSRSQSHIHRSQSLSPRRAEHSQRLAWLSLDSTTPRDQDTSSPSEPLMASWPGAGRSAAFTSSSSPLTPSSSTVRFSGRRSFLSDDLLRGSSADGAGSSKTPDHNRGQHASDLWRSYREQARNSRAWEEVHERVRGLLTTPKAVRRLVYGATHSEVDEVLARRSISPGPP